MQTQQGKKVTTVAKKTGIKLHIAVDVLGNPYAATVTTANVDDREGAVKMFSEMPFYLPDLQLVLTDGGYTGDDFAFHIWDILRANVEVAKRSELHKFAVMPKRWIVERTFAWLDKCRRLWKNCERLLSTTLNFFNLASISIMLRRRS